MAYQACQPGQHRACSQLGSGLETLNASNLSTRQSAPAVPIGGPLGWQVGAQVMLLKNLDLDGGGGQMLVNGSRGVVTEFVDKPVRPSQPRLSASGVSGTPVEMVLV